MKNRIIVLTEYVGERENTTSYYWGQIIKRLSSDYDIVLISPNKESVREFALQHDICFKAIPLVKFNKNRLISRLIGQFRFTIHFLYALVSELKSGDIVFSGTNPIITMFFISAISKIIKFKWVLLVHDVFPNNLAPASIVSKRSLMFRFLDKISKFMYSRPDRLIAIGRDMKLLLSRKLGKPKTIQYVSNWAPADSKILQTNSKLDNKIIRDLGWENYTVFQFFGNMGRLQGLPNLLNAIKLTKTLNSRFIFIGSGSESQFVNQEVAEINTNAGYDKAFYFGSLPIESNKLGLNACDVSFVTLTKGMFGLGVPSKAYFSMAVDKPILFVGDSGSELELLISEYDIGWYCEPNNPAKLALLIDEISDLIVTKARTLPKPRTQLINYFPESLSLDRIASILDNVRDL